jgi:tetratricopeptide (TPR) repeat protein
VLAPRVLVDRFDTDDPDVFGQHADTQGDRQGTVGVGQVHVGDPVTSLVHPEQRRIEHVRDDHQHRAGGPTGHHRIDDDQRIRVVEERLDEMDATGADVEHIDAVGDPVVDQPVDDVHADTVVPSQQAPEPGDHDAHGGRLRTAVDDEVIAELERRLARQPPERYPIQHATTSFHLGTARLQGGDVDGAIEALNRSVELFESLPLERAKAANMVGIALREAGRADEAAAAFERATSDFAASGARLEEAAARYNLGLVRVQQGRSGSAELAAALDLFRAEGATRQSAAAGRELGQALLVEGRLDDAVAALEVAASTAERCGDEAGRAAAANALGLAKLAAGAPEAAVEAFQIARAANPRSVRPSEHALAAANLALALERCGDAARSRLAARQARAVPGADQRVRDQCDDVLARLGHRHDDLVVVLREEPRDRWAVLLRDELERWADEADDERHRAAAALCDELTRTGGSDDLAEAVLASALEMPADRMEAVLTAVSTGVSAHGDEASDRGRARLSRAAARFHLPQMTRLEALLLPSAPTRGDG